MPRCLRLPCSAQQALALYQHLFGCPAGLGQLQAALQQVPESRACPPGLELPITLLAMEQSRWAQEQLLWDLELLTGAGLGLFWPPQAHSSSLWGRGVRSWWDEPPGSTVGGPERWQHEAVLSCGGHWAHPVSQGGTALSPGQLLPGVLSHTPTMNALRVTPTCGSPRREPQLQRARRVGRERPEPGTQSSASHRPLPTQEDGRVGGEHPGSPALMAGQTAGLQGAAGTHFPAPAGWAGGDHIPEHRRGVGRHQDHPRRCPPDGSRTQWTSPPAPTPSRVLGCAPRHKPRTPRAMAVRFQRGASAQMLEKPEVTQDGRAGLQCPHLDLTPRGERGEAGVVTPSAQGTSGLPEPRGPGWVLYGERGRELAELEKLLRIEGPQHQEAAQPREETPERQRGEVSGGQSGEDPRGESPRTGALPEPTPQGQEESLSSGGRASRAQEEGDSLDTRGHSGSSPGERTPQPGGRESPGPRRRTTPPLLPGQEPGPAQEGAGGPHSARCPGAATRAARRAGDSELREGPAAPPGAQESAGSPAREEGGEAGAPEPPRAPRAAWTRAPGVSAAQQESALQRLLELHRAARRRRGREREQQRLRVLEGLRIARNRRCRVHPLGPPLQQAQLPLQEDAAGQRRALREQLQQVHLERTRRLWTQGARNTQNFQQLLCPSSTSEPELLDPQKEMGALQRNT